MERYSRDKNGFFLILPSSLCERSNRFSFISTGVGPLYLIGLVLRSVLRARIPCAARNAISSVDGLNHSPWLLSSANCLCSERSGYIAASSDPSNTKGTGEPHWRHSRRRGKEVA